MLTHVAILGASHIADLYELFQDPETCGILRLTPPKDRSDHQRLMSGAIAAPKPGVTLLVIINSTTQRAIGFIQIDESHCAIPELSIAIEPAARRHGYALDAVNVVLARLRSQNIVAVEAVVASNNISAQGLLTKLGFVAKIPDDGTNIVFKRSPV